MKILQCISSLEGGGAEKQFGYLCESLSALGHDIVAVSIRRGPNLDRVLNSGATYVQVRSLGNFDPLVIWQLRRLVQSHKPDLVQSWIPQMDILMGLVCALEKIPHVISERTSAAGLTSGWREFFRVAIARRASAIVANGLGGEEYWRSRATCIPTVIIPNSIPFSDIESAVPFSESDIGLKPGDELVVYLGQLIQIKNISNLVSALIEVVSRRRQTQAVFVGEGPLSALISSTVVEAGYGDQIRVVPFSTAPFRWLKRAELFVSVSEFEGNPNAVLEAIAAECPVVVSDIPAHREFLDDLSAKFVSGRSSASIAAGILASLENPGEAQARAALARKRLATRTGISVAQRYVDVYEKILS